MTAVDVAAVGALVVSGVAYTFGLTSMFVAAGPALALLLVWVGHTGVAVTRVGR
jgi:hypothetical protein